MTATERKRNYGSAKLLELIKIQHELETKMRRNSFNNMGKQFFDLLLEQYRDVVIEIASRDKIDNKITVHYQDGVKLS